jgi:hypothetical protein
MQHLGMMWVPFLMHDVLMPLVMIMAHRRPPPPVAVAVVGKSGGRSIDFLVRG